MWPPLVWTWAKRSIPTENYQLSEFAIVSHNNGQKGGFFNLVVADLRLFVDLFFVQYCRDVHLDSQDPTFFLKLSLHIVLEYTRNGLAFSSCWCFGMS
jgi:hypothetical protein